MVGLRTKPPFGSIGSLVLYANFTLPFRIANFWDMVDLVFFAVTVGFSTVIAFFLSDRLLVLIERASAPRWLGPYFCIMFTLFPYPIAIYFLVTWLNALAGGSSDMGFGLGYIGGCGLLGGLIGAPLAIHRRRSKTF